MLYEIQDKNERQATRPWYLEEDEKHGKLVKIVAVSSPLCKTTYTIRKTVQVML
jgi:hypothetical protein